MTGKLVAPASGAYIAVCLLVLAASSESVDIVSRSTWGAAAATVKNNVRTTATHVIVHHTVTPTCSGSGCYSRLRELQSDHFGRRYGDIGYNFLIGNDGSIFEGQGFGRRGSHAGNANGYSIGVSFIGNFETSTPSQAALNSLKDLINHAIQGGYLRSNYKLVGHRSVKATACPGRNLYSEISKMDKFSSTL